MAKSRADLQKLGRFKTDQGNAEIGKKRTDHGKTKFFNEGGTMKNDKPKKMPAFLMKKAAPAKKGEKPKGKLPDFMMKKGGKAKC